MEYAPIKAIKFVNFRNFDSLELGFKGSSILTLVGDNEAGKSTVSKGFETLGAHLNPNTQKDYIRSGTPGFMVATLFDDEHNTIAYRKKGPGFNGFGVIQDGKEIWNTDKMDVNEVPPQISKFMGFIIDPETKEVLNVRTYENLLMFIYTTGSSNYKIMYNALKLENMAKAIKLGTSEANIYKRNIDSDEASIKTVQEQLRGIRDVDLSPIFSIRERLVNEQKSIHLLEQANDLLNRIYTIDSQLGALTALDNTESINELEVQTLNNLFSTALQIASDNKQIKGLAGIENVQTVNEVEAQTLNNLLGSAKEINSIESKLRIYGQMQNFQEIQTDEITLLNTCITLNDELQRINIGAYSDINEVEIVNEREVELWGRVGEIQGELGKIEGEVSIYSADMTGVDENDINLLNRILTGLQSVTELEALGASIKSTEDEISVYEGKLKSFGVMVATCRNCGETVIMGEHTHE